MNVRRLLVLGVLAGALATGLVIDLSAQVDAHIVAVTPAAACVPGASAWQVVWTVTSSNTTLTGSVTVESNGGGGVSLAGQTATLPTPGSVKFIQSNIPTSSTLASILVQESWPDNVISESQSQISQPPNCVIAATPTTTTTAPPSPTTTTQPPLPNIPPATPQGVTQGNG